MFEDLLDYNERVCSTHLAIDWTVHRIIVLALVSCSFQQAGEQDVASSAAGAGHCTVETNVGVDESNVQHAHAAGQQDDTDSTMRQRRSDEKSC